ncbi:hypothetical protein QF000_000277 [Paraburkholderia atlantica]|uniref:Uncharacterized protein n=1 Tax=Paraburkholderia youngii TaxID=2782701 RepID=A0A7W8LDK1_9BURK|nr:hypothetical protein [Paraburkholderia youngii]MBB5405067.1 hypothetical protein [Paraburkholderia youngii]
MLSAEFPTKLLMVATVLAWEETSDRTIRDILPTEVKETIAAKVAENRAARIASENEAHSLISRVSVKPIAAEAKALDLRSDGEKVADELRMLETLTDRTAATMMVDALTGLADEFDIERMPRD